MGTQIEDFRRTIIAGCLCFFTAIHFAIGQTVDTDIVYFTEITAELGFDDTPEPWPDGTYATHEVIGGGIALFDYDNDGDLDLLQIRFPPPGQIDTPAPNRLFQQQPDGIFLDVTAAAGLGDPGYGQGVAIGDVDNDGDLDVYVTNFGPDAFYRNNGDGTFVNGTKHAGFSNDRWGTSAAFVDYDRDGDLDLYVVNYVQFDPATVCRGKHSAQDYCNPQVFENTLDVLYRNNGDGTFTDVTAHAGITSPGRGLGIVCVDLTADGWVDFYVANDGEANQLWVNNRDGTFTDEAILRGVAFNTYGQPEGSMGVTVGDINGDKKLDLFTTHLTGETNTLYISSEYTIFTDATEVSGFVGSDLPFTGFGCGFFDFDHDSDLDLALVNGRVKRSQVVDGANVGTFWNAYAEPNLLFQNDGTGHFTGVNSRASTFAKRVEVSRGLAFGDIDRDGDLDLAIANLNGVRVFRNDAPPHGTHWLLVRAVTGKRDAIGAQVTVIAAGRKFIGLVLPGYSYLSSNDPRVHFGLGKIEVIEAIEVVWPDGARERFKVSSVDREWVVRQGEGESQ
ncbi:CRTAC1 family protein [Candidatus Poribacteria bacterium]|nr:CRTAC1 family protein [Candidatus Poribacteria bacterium]